MQNPRDKVIITCAVTGNQTLPSMTPHLPITPEQIAEACLGAAEAGAAITHIHVRDPATGMPSMEIDYYRQVVELIRAKNTSLILNITTGPGGRFAPSEHDPKIAGPGTLFLTPAKRTEHIAMLRPDIATLDLNTMTFGAQVVINTPPNVRKMAQVIYAAGTKPEIELFDSGDILLMHDLIKDGTLKGPHLVSLVLGVKYGFRPGARDRACTPARCCRPTANSPPSAPAAPRSRWWRRPTSRAGMSGSASRTASICAAACWPKPMRRWSRRRATSSNCSAARRCRRPRRARILGSPMQGERRAAPPDVCRDGVARPNLRPASTFSPD